MASCQKDDGTALKTPGQTPRYLANPDELGASFRSTIVNLKSLHDLGDLPSSIFAVDIYDEPWGCLAQALQKCSRHPEGQKCATRLIQDVEGSKDQSTRHHEQYPQYQKKFKNMKTVTLPAGKRIVCTLLEECLVVPEGSLNLLSLAPCSHEEADTRILLHLANAIACGHISVLIRINDSDVVVLARKRSAWQAWQACPGLTSALLELSSPVSHVHDPVKRVLPIIETFVTRLYGVESVDLVNAARKTLFLNKGKQFVQIPPSSDALQLHLLRAVHESAFVWGGLLIRDPLVPSPEEWGWQRSGSAFVLITYHCPHSRHPFLNCPFARVNLCRTMQQGIISLSEINHSLIKKSHA
ncbi:hypothetical protein CAPTEDRAFT_224609 [Capitella teleta]|uniref:Uncharacterized protein n=1 Tax=Capitella teleta TaxID=283909 RepID=R7V6C2_CAPTE|nr:hypothetical protein CAPTEDRAFT_224609 [Capitella teleta]|eukprot:ELU14119.1 hypothetical protein CAPTEDRAFT_224609 [Capitella teleta]